MKLADFEYQVTKNNIHGINFSNTTFISRTTGVSIKDITIIVTKFGNLPNFTDKLMTILRGRSDWKIIKSNIRKA